jgi:hypothetical protein
LIIFCFTLFQLLWFKVHYNQSKLPFSPDSTNLSLKAVVLDWKRKGEDMDGMDRLFQTTCLPPPSALATGRE